MKKPDSIILFARLFLGAMALGAINFAFRWSDATTLLAQSPEAKAAGIGLGFLIAVFVVSTSINLALWYFISRRASKVAKWIQTMFYLIGLASFAWTFNNPLEPQGLGLAISVVILIIYGAATAMLFRPDAIAWFDRKPFDPGTFR
jgi:hypothetical protein